MKTKILNNSAARAQLLRAKLQEATKKTLKFSSPDEVFRVTVRCLDLKNTDRMLESHLWNPSREEALTLADGSTLRVAQDGSLEWIDAGRGLRTEFMSFARSLALPHAWAQIQLQRAHLEESPCAPLFVAFPNREEEEQRNTAIQRKTALSSALLALTVVLIDWIFTGAEPRVRESQPVPEAFVKLLSRPIQAQTQAQASAPHQTERGTSQALQKNLKQAVQSKSLQKTLARFLAAPSPVLASRSPAGALPLSGKGESSPELHQKLTALSRLTETGPGLVEGRLAGSRLGNGQPVQVAGQGKAFVSLRPEDAKVEEGLTKDEVGEVIHRHAAEIRYCYEAAMLRRPDLEGKLAIAFTIGGQGGVLTSRVLQSSMDDPRIGDCVLAKLTTWKFPRPKGGIEVPVTYPFIFKSLGKG